MLYENSFLTLSANEPDAGKVEEAFAHAAEWLHGKNGFTPEMMGEQPVRSLVEQTAALLNNAISYGLANGKPSEKLVEGLRGSAYLFSGFKSFHEMKEAANLLVDENGNKKPFNQYLNDVQKINATYNKQYLKAEYDFASGSAQMAAKWDELAQDEDRYNLQYRTAGDDKVRKAHKELDGTTLPASDPFWNSYYPPNGWACRCTVSKVRKAKYAPSNSREAVEKGNKATAGKHQEMFRFNPGKQQAAYPAYNSYTIGKCATCSKEGFTLAKIPNNELCQACGVIREMKRNKGELKQQRGSIKDWAKKNLIGKTVQVDNLKEVVTFTVSGIKEALNQPHKYIREKNEAVKNIQKLLKEATYIRSDADGKGREFVYHYLKTTIHQEDSYIVIRENTRNKLVDFYSIVEKIKEP